MNEVRVGLVGAGFMGEAHAACYQQDPRVTLGRVAAGRAESAARFAARLGIPHHSGRWQDVIEDPAIDAVDIVAPNDLHAAVAIAAAQAGKAILIEKPLARSLDEADRVVETVGRRGVIAVYAENRRFCPALQRMHGAVTEGCLGQPLLLGVTEMGSGPSHGAWFWNAERAGGGALIDMGIHGLATTEWLMQDRVAYVQAMDARLRWGDRLGPGVEDTMLTLARFADGGMAQLACSWAYSGGLELRFELVGSLGTAIADLGRGASGLSLYSETVAAPVRTERRPHQAAPQGWSFPLTDEWRQKGHLGEIRHFVDCVLGEAAPTCTLADGYRCLQLAEAIRRAARERCEVPVPPRPGFAERSRP
jgi:myo-inositol 2-dehydrogenase / D-chiro-inositol 1-dehydrogenase